MFSIMSMLSMFRRKSGIKKVKRGTLSRRRRRRRSNESIRVTKLPYIPRNIMEEIFHKLPYNVMTICKLVCKTWNSIISSPNFINDHYNRLRVQGNTHLISLECDFISQRNKCNFRTLCHSDIVANRSFSMTNRATSLENILTKEWYYQKKLIGSYNGLVAISCYNKLILWNPLTDKYSFVEVDLYDKEGYRLLYGLCYDNVKDEYRVVVGSDDQSPPISPSNFDEYDDDITYECTRVYLHDFKNGSYKELDGYSFARLDNRLFKGEIGKVICGVPHWVVQYYEWEDPSANRKTDILYFDLREEEFKEMDKPSGCVEKKLLGLAAMNGENELGCVLDDDVSSCFEIWVMKEYGNVESWTNLYTFSYMNLMDTTFGCINYLDVMGFMPNNGELLICLNDYDYYKLLVYDVYKGINFIFKEIESKYGKSFELVTFEPKLISPPHPLPKSDDETQSEIEENEDDDDDSYY